MKRYPPENADGSEVPHSNDGTARPLEYYSPRRADEQPRKPGIMAGLSTGIGFSVFLYLLMCGGLANNAPWLLLAPLAIKSTLGIALLPSRAWRRFGGGVLLSILVVGILPALVLGKCAGVI